ncbi:hypothetical protein L6452_40631 [Arctium lappa]|uniref:Uncharacterized protein n=1 Tax=Arctium lappa TaxID=4217 RepID=A0ACB8XNA3_ARCLA|nr:hypothetical protein L6452_40631 [Arctium lappa]
MKIKINREEPFHGQIRPEERVGGYQRLTTGDDGVGDIRGTPPGLCRQSLRHQEMELNILRVTKTNLYLDPFHSASLSLQLKVKKLTEKHEKNDGETKKKEDLGQPNEEIELKRRKTSKMVVFGDKDSDTDNHQTET